MAGRARRPLLGVSGDVARSPLPRLELKDRKQPALARHWLLLTLFGIVALGAFVWYVSHAYGHRHGRVPLWNRFEGWVLGSAADAAGAGDLRWSEEAAVRAESLLPPLRLAAVLPTLPPREADGGPPGTGLLRGRAAVTVVFNRAVVALGAAPPPDVTDSPSVLLLPAANASAPPQPAIVIACFAAADPDNAALAVSVPGAWRLVTTATARFDPAVDWPANLLCRLSISHELTAFDGETLQVQRDDLGWTSNGIPLSSAHFTPKQSVVAVDVTSALARAVTGGWWDPLVRDEHLPGGASGFEVPPGATLHLQFGSPVALADVARAIRIVAHDVGDADAEDDDKAESGDASKGQPAAAAKSKAAPSSGATKRSSQQPRQPPAPALPFSVAACEDEARVAGYGAAAAATVAKRAQASKDAPLYSSRDLAAMAPLTSSLMHCVAVTRALPATLQPVRDSSGRERIPRSRLRGLHFSDERVGARYLLVLPKGARLGPLDGPLERSLSVSFFGLRPFRFVFNEGDQSVMSRRLRLVLPHGLSLAPRASVEPGGGGGGGDDDDDDNDDDEDEDSVGGAAAAEWSSPHSEAQLAALRAAMSFEPRVAFSLVRVDAATLLLDAELAVETKYTLRVRAEARVEDGFGLPLEASEYRFATGAAVPFLAALEPRVVRGFVVEQPRAALAQSGWPVFVRGSLSALAAHGAPPDPRIEASALEPQLAVSSMASLANAVETHPQANATSTGARVAVRAGAKWTDARAQPLALAALLSASPAVAVSSFTSQRRPPFAIAVSDLAVSLFYFQSDRELVAWVTRLSSGDNVAAANVTLTLAAPMHYWGGVSHAAAPPQEIVLFTDSNGTASARLPPSFPPGFYDVSALVQTAADKDWLLVPGVAHVLVAAKAELGVRGTLFTDCGVYRRNDTIFVKGFVRRQVSAESDLPAQWRPPASSDASATELYWLEVRWPQPSGGFVAAGGGAPLRARVHPSEQLGAFDMQIPVGLASGFGVASIELMSTLRKPAQQKGAPPPPPREKPVVVPVAPNGFSREGEENDEVVIDGESGSKQGRVVTAAVEAALVQDLILPAEFERTYAPLGVRMLAFENVVVADPRPPSVQLDLESGLESIVLRAESLRAAPLEPTSLQAGLSVPFTLRARTQQNTPAAGAKIELRWRAHTSEGAVVDGRLDVEAGLDGKAAVELPLDDLERAIRAEHMRKRTFARDERGGARPLDREHTTLEVEADWVGPTGERVLKSLRLPVVSSYWRVVIEKSPPDPVPGLAFLASVRLEDALGQSVDGVKFDVRLFAWDALDPGATPREVADAIQQRGLASVSSCTGVPSAPSLAQSPALCTLVLPSLGRFVLVAELSNSADAMLLLERQPAHHRAPIAISGPCAVEPVGKRLDEWAEAPLGDAPPVHIMLDRHEYDMGDTAKLIVINPFPRASALVVWGGNDQATSRRRELHSALPAGTSSLAVPLGDECRSRCSIAVVVVVPRIAESGRAANTTAPLAATAKTKAQAAAGAAAAIAANKSETAWVRAARRASALFPIDMPVSPLVDFAKPRAFRAAFSPRVKHRTRSRLSVVVEVERPVSAPGSRCNLRVTVRDNATALPRAAELTLWMVNKAWLQLQQHPLPDLVPFFDLGERESDTPSVWASHDAVVSRLSLEHFAAITEERLRGDPFFAPYQLALDEPEITLSDAAFARWKWHTVTQGGSSFGYRNKRRGGLSMPLAAAMVAESAAISSADAAVGAGAGGGSNRDATAPAVRSEANFVTTPFFISRLRVDESGVAEKHFALPQNIGSFVVRAVAVAEGDESGSGEAEVVVEKPFVSLVPSLPRLVRVGDVFECGFVLTARAAHSVVLELHHDAALEVVNRRGDVDVFILTASGTAAHGAAQASGQQRAGVRTPRPVASPRDMAPAVAFRRVAVDAQAPVKALFTLRALSTTAAAGLLAVAVSADEFDAVADGKASSAMPWDMLRASILVLPPTSPQVLGTSMALSATSAHPTVWREGLVLPRVALGATALLHVSAGVGFLPQLTALAEQSALAVGCVGEAHEPDRLRSESAGAAEWLAAGLSRALLNRVYATRGGGGGGGSASDTSESSLETRSIKALARLTSPSHGLTPSMAARLTHVDLPLNAWALLAVAETRRAAQDPGFVGRLDALLDDWRNASARELEAQCAREAPGRSVPVSLVQSAAALHLALPSDPAASSAPLLGAECVSFDRLLQIVDESVGASPVRALVTLHLARSAKGKGDVATLEKLLREARSHLRIQGRTAYFASGPRSEAAAGAETQAWLMMAFGENHRRRPSTQSADDMRLMARVANALAGLRVVERGWLDGEARTRLAKTLALASYDQGAGNDDPALSLRVLNPQGTTVFDAEFSATSSRAPVSQTLPWSTLGPQPASLRARSAALAAKLDRAFVAEGRVAGGASRKGDENGDEDGDGGKGRDRDASDGSGDQGAPWSLHFVTSGKGEVGIALLMSFVPAALPTRAVRQGLSVERLVRECSAPQRPSALMYQDDFGPHAPVVRFESAADLGDDLAATLLEGSSELQRVNVSARSIVCVTLQIVTPDDLAEVVVEDRLPGGLEPIDSTLSSVRTSFAEGVDDDEAEPVPMLSSLYFFRHLPAYGATRVTVERERVVFTVPWLSAGSKSLTYRATATGCGWFVHPPAVAYSATQEEVRGATPATVLRVLC